MAARLYGLILSAILLPACHESGREEPGGSPSSAPTELRAVLGGGQESPPVASPGGGTLEVRIPAGRSSIEFTLSVDRLSGPTAARLHAGAPGTPGPVLFTLASGPFSSPRSGVLTAADFSPAPGFDTFDQAVRAILEGATYVNVLTASHPEGEIRGHVGPLSFQILLDGSRGVPPVATAGRGFARVELDGTQRRLEVTLTTSDLSGPPTEAHVHAGGVGIEGPVILNLATTAFASPLTVVLTSVHLVHQPAFGVDSFDDAIDALLSRNAYLDVHTAAHPDGEIRGQAVP